MNPSTLKGATRTVETEAEHQVFDDGSEVSKSQFQINRRTFCNRLLLTSTVLMVGVDNAVSEAATAQESLLAYPPTKIQGAEKLIVGSSLYFDYPTRKDPAVLLRLSEGQYAAFSRKCSHAGCSVEFDVAGRCLKCPCHRGAYDSRIGYVMYGPPQRPLDQIALQVRAGGEVWAVGKCIGNNAERFAQSPKSPEVHHSQTDLDSSSIEKKSSTLA